MRTRLVLALTLTAASIGFACAPARSAADDTPNAAEAEKWSHHTGKIPFIVGYEKGMKEVEFTGKPPMLFFTTTWCHFCKQLAEESFSNPEVLKAVAYFTPIIVDGDVEKETCQKYGAQGWPHTVFCDAKGEQVGQPVGGYVPTPSFLKSVQAAAKKIKPGKPSKDFTTLTAAKADLDAAIAGKKIGDALTAVSKIEKVNRPGDILDAALAAKKQLLEDGKKRLEFAKTASAGDGKDAVLKELKRLVTEYKGTDIATEAAKLVKELEPPKDAK